MQCFRYYYNCNSQLRLSKKKDTTKNKYYLLKKKYGDDEKSSDRKIELNTTANKRVAEDCK